MKKVNKKIWLNGTDSGKTYRTSWLPRGIMTIAWGESTGIIMPNSTYNDKKGQCGAFKMGKERKVLQIINMYRITNSSSGGTMTVKAQLDRRVGTLNYVIIGPRY